MRRVLFAAILLAACAGPAAPSPQALLEGAAQDVDLKTVRFSLVREGEPVMLDPLTGTRFSEASGAYQVPDRVRARVKAQVAALALEF